MESRLAKPRDYYHTFESYRCMLARVHRLPCWKAGALPVRLENGGVGEWLNPAVLKSLRTESRDGQIRLGGASISRKWRKSG